MLALYGVMGTDERLASLMESPHSVRGNSSRLPSRMNWPRSFAARTDRTARACCAAVANRKNVSARVLVRYRPQDEHSTSYRSLVVWILMRVVSDEQRAHCKWEIGTGIGPPIEMGANA